MEEPEVDIRKRQLRVTFGISGAVGAAVGIWVAATWAANRLRDFDELRRTVGMHEQQIAGIIGGEIRLPAVEPVAVGPLDCAPCPGDRESRRKQYRTADVRPAVHRTAVPRASSDGVR